MVNDPSASIKAKSYLGISIGLSFHHYLENIAAIEKTSVEILIVAALTEYCTEELLKDIADKFLDNILVIVLNDEGMAPTRYWRYLRQGVHIRVQLEAELFTSLQKIADQRQTNMEYICGLALQNYWYAKRMMEKGEV